MSKFSSPALIPFQVPHSDPTLYSLAPCRWLIGASNLVMFKKNSWFHSHFASAPNLFLPSLLSHDKWHHYSSTCYKPKSLSSHIQSQSVIKLRQFHPRNPFIIVISFTTSTSAVIFQLGWPFYSLQDRTLDLNNLFPIQQPK